MAEQSKVINNESTRPVRWLSLDETAKRVGRNIGHLRKICPALRVRGLARKVKARTGQTRWEIRSDFRMDRDPPELIYPPFGKFPVVISAGDVLITVESEAPARVIIDTIGRETTD